MIAALILENCDMITVGTNKEMADKEMIDSLLECIELNNIQKNVVFTGDVSLEFECAHDVKIVLANVRKDILERLTLSSITVIEITDPNKPGRRFYHMPWSKDTPDMANNSWQSIVIDGKSNEVHIKITDNESLPGGKLSSAVC